ncbi:MAG: DUF1801 domain-containing protein [Myxococcota bacterium]
MTERTSAPAMPEKVTEAFERYPPHVRMKLSQMRDLIFRTAEHSEIIGRVTETTKWGEPAYLTEETKTGSTIRLGAPRDPADRCAMYFNCNTNLVESFRERWGDRLDYSGNRALVFPVNADLPIQTLGICIEAALTYHVLKRDPDGLSGYLRRQT